MGKKVIESVSRSINDSVKQSAGLNWLHDDQGRGGSRVDPLVIGLRGVINRPESKQHLR